LPADCRLQCAAAALHTATTALQCVQRACSLAANTAAHTACKHCLQIRPTPSSGPRLLGPLKGHLELHSGRPVGQTTPPNWPPSSPTSGAPFWRPPRTAWPRCSAASGQCLQTIRRQVRGEKKQWAARKTRSPFFELLARGRRPTLSARARVAATERQSKAAPRDSLRLYSCAAHWPVARPSVCLLALATRGHNNKRLLLALSSHCWPLAAVAADQTAAKALE